MEVKLVTAASRGFFFSLAWITIAASPLTIAASLRKKTPLAPRVRPAVSTVRTYRVLSHFQTVNTTADQFKLNITIVLGLQGEQQSTQAVVFLTDLPQWQVYLNLGGHSLE